jgi:hypothetical protein
MFVDISGTAGRLLELEWSVLGGWRGGGTAESEWSVLGGWRGGAAPSNISLIFVEGLSALLGKRDDVAVLVPNDDVPPPQSELPALL